jgi:hypothetical protein
MNGTAEDIREILDLKRDERTGSPKTAGPGVSKLATTSLALGWISLSLALMSLATTVTGEGELSLSIALVFGLGSFVLGALAILLSPISMIVIKSSHGARTGYRRAIIALVVCLAAAGALFGAVVVFAERFFRW